MNNLAIKIFSVSTMLILVGCVSQPTLPGAQSVVLVSQSPDYENCTLLGDISSSQGSMLSGGLVSDDSLLTAVKNDMRNQTYLLGGNVVYIQELKLNALYAMSTNNASGLAKVFNCNNTGLVAITDSIIDSNLPIKNDSTVVSTPQALVNSPVAENPAIESVAGKGINKVEPMNTLEVPEAVASTNTEPVIVNKVVGTSEMANGLRYAQLASAYGDQYEAKIAQSATYSSGQQQELCSLSKQAADNFVKAEAIFRKCQESIWNTGEEIKACGFNAQVSRGFIAKYQSYYQGSCVK